MEKQKQNGSQSSDPLSGGSAPTCQGAGRPAPFLTNIEAENLFKRLSERTAHKGVCWIWQGARSGPYGMVTIKNKNIMTHRAMWLAVNKSIPSLHVLHSCDTPLCINPKHLFLGTHRDNMRDMANKDRVTYGEDHYLAKLTSEKALAIAKAQANGASIKGLARFYGVHKKTIQRIVNGQSWRRAIAASLTGSFFLYQVATVGLLIDGKVGAGQIRAEKIGKVLEWTGGK